MLEAAGHQVTRADLPGLDIPTSTSASTRCAGHDVVVNSAAYTAVDAAETDEARAFAVNAVGAANLARAAHVAGAAMVQLSTDYVVAGEKREPYAADAPRRAALPPTAAPRAAGEWAVRAECPRSLGGAHGVAVRGARQELPRRRCAARGGARAADRRRRPAWASRPGPSTSPRGCCASSRRARRTASGTPRARGSARGSSWPGPCSRSSGSTPSGSHRSRRRVPHAGATAGLQRARPRHVGRGGARAAAHWRDALRRAAPACWVLRRAGPSPPATCIVLRLIRSGSWMPMT